MNDNEHRRLVAIDDPFSDLEDESVSISQRPTLPAIIIPIPEFDWEAMCDDDSK